MSETLVALALLKVNWDLQHASYTDNFNVLTIECLRKINQPVVSAPELKEALLRDFGLRLPLRVVEKLVKRAAKKGFVSRRHGVYEIDRRKVASLDYRESNTKALLAYERLVDGAVAYAGETFGLEWERRDAERALEKYISDNTLSLFTATARRSYVRFRVILAKHQGMFWRVT